MSTYTRLLLTGVIALTACSVAVATTELGLMTHNQLRQLHGAPKLQWDAELAGYAAKHAARCQFKHSDYPYGENLAIGYPSASEAIKAWYGENKNYSYQHPGFSHNTGHFTQLIWKSTTKVGCAIAACDGRNLLVCEYSPMGNINSAEYFNANVERLG